MQIYLHVSPLREGSLLSAVGTDSSVVLLDLILADWGAHLSGAGPKG